MSVRLNMQRVSMLMTRGVARYFGEAFPFYYVMEYPKSGGSWLADMIADYLQIPRPVQPVFPIGFRAVIHGHWSYSPRLRRVTYLYRDGRDVATSMYFRALQLVHNAPDRAVRSYLGRRAPSLLQIEAGDASRLPQFIEEWARGRLGAHMSWSRHIEQWTCNRPHVVTVSYEQLLEEPVEHMDRVLCALTGEETNLDRLSATVHKFSFAQQTGRSRGSEDRTSFLRKGIAGDWKAHFNRESGRIFDSHFGSTLVQLGYEPDREWWKSLPE
jgi:hypothetical protein